MPLFDLPLEQLRGYTSSVAPPPDLQDFWDATIREARTFPLTATFEPDGCFYVQNERRIRGKQRIDLTVDPPPDLVIEVDITSPSLDKLPIFVRAGAVVKQRSQFGDGVDIDGFPAHEVGRAGSLDRPDWAFAVDDLPHERTT